MKMASQPWFKAPSITDGQCMDKCYVQYIYMLKHYPLISRLTTGSNRRSEIGTAHQNSEMALPFFQLKKDNWQVPGYMFVVKWNWHEFYETQLNLNNYLHSQLVRITDRHGWPFLFHSNQTFSSTYISRIM